MRKLLWLVSAVLLSSVAGWAQGFCYPGGSAQTTTSATPNAVVRVMSGAYIRVCREPATGANCTPLANIYSNPDLNPIHQLPNPFQADGEGNYTFCAAGSPPNYHIQISQSGVRTQDVSNITLGGGQQAAGGSDKDVQLNCDGALCGNSFFTYDYVNDKGDINDLATEFFPVIDVRWYGAVGDAVQVNACNITASTHGLSCTDPFGRGFTPSSVGKTIQVPLAGTPDGYGSPLVTTIASYISASSVNLTAAAVQTPSSPVNVTYGTDNGTYFCNATQCTSSTYTGIYGDGILSGRELAIPGGTYLSTQPFYVRNGMKVNGAISGTQIILVGGAYKLTAPASGIFATPHVSPTICAGHNDGTGGCVSDATSSGTTGQTSIHNILASAPYVRTPAILLTGEGGEAGAFSASYVWTESYYGIVAFHTNYTSLDHFTCDTGTTICETWVGDGTDSSTSQYYGNQSTNSQIGLGQIGIWIDGTKDLLISNMNCNFDFNHQESFPVDCIYFNSPEGYSSYRVNIDHSNFLSNCQDHSQLSACTQTYIEYNSPCIDCSVLNSDFAYGGQKDILLNSSATGTTNLLISHDHFIHGSQGSGSSFSQANGSPFTGSVIFDTDVWDTPGNYAIFSADMDAKLFDSKCINPFAITAPVSSGANDYSNGCFYFTGDSPYTVTAFNNSVTNSGTPCGSGANKKCPAVSINGISTTITGYTQNNTSDYATCATCVYTGSSGIFSSSSEVAVNYGGSGVAGFINVPFAGGLTLGSLSGGGTQCVHVNNAGTLSGTGSDCGSGGGGGGAFSSITSGTNTSATMTVGTGATLTVSGSGINNANQVNGAAPAVSALVLGSNGSGQLVAQLGTITNNTTGNAATATAFATSPTQCTGYAHGVDISGNAQCDPPSSDSDIVFTIQSRPGTVAAGKAACGVDSNGFYCINNSLANVGPLQPFAISGFTYTLTGAEVTPFVAHTFTIDTPAAAGWYDVGVRMVQLNTAACSGSTATVSAQLDYTDAETTVHVTGSNNMSLWTEASGATTSTGSTAAFNSSSGAPGAGTIWDGVPRRIHVAASTALKIIFNIATDTLTCTTFPQLEMFPVVYKIQ